MRTPATLPTLRTHVPKHEGALTQPMAAPMVPLDSSLFWAVSEPWTHRGFLLPAPGQRRVPPRSPCARRGAPMCSREKVAAQHGWGLSALASTQEHEESYIVLQRGI